MKKSLLLYCFLLLTSSSFSQRKVDTTFILTYSFYFYSLQEAGRVMEDAMPGIKFDKTIYRSPTSGYVEGKIQFINTSALPLIIENVQTATSDCVAFFDSDPVLPGGKGVIRFQIQRTHLTDRFTRIITMKANISDNEVIFTINGEKKIL